MLVLFNTFINALDNGLDLANLQVAPNWGETAGGWDMGWLEKWSCSWEGLAGTGGLADSSRAQTDQSRPGSAGVRAKLALGLGAPSQPLGHRLGTGFSEGRKELIK